MRQHHLAAMLLTGTLTAGLAGCTSPADDPAEGSTTTPPEAETTTPGTSATDVPAGTDVSGTSPGHLRMQFGMDTYAVEPLTCTSDDPDGRTFTATGTTGSVTLELGAVDPTGEDRIAGDGVQYQLRIIDHETDVDITVHPEPDTLVTLEPPVIAIIGFMRNDVTSETAMVSAEGACGAS